MIKRLKTKKLSHDELKEMGKRLLSDEGFDSTEIHTEYTIKAANDKRYILDVAAVRDGKVLVGVECGDLQVGKFAIITELIPKVVHIPYHLKARPNVTLDYCALYTENERLKRQLKESMLVDRKNEEEGTHNISKDSDLPRGGTPLKKLLEGLLCGAEKMEKSIPPSSEKEDIESSTPEPIPVHKGTKEPPQSELLQRLDEVIEKLERLETKLKKGEENPAGQAGSAPKQRKGIGSTCKDKYLPEERTTPLKNLLIELLSEADKLENKKKKPLEKGELPRAFEILKELAKKAKEEQRVGESENKKEVPHLAKVGRADNTSMSGKLPKNPSAFVRFMQELLMTIEEEEKKKEGKGAPKKPELLRRCVLPDKNSDMREEPAFLTELRALRTDLENKYQGGGGK